MENLILGKRAGRGKGRSRGGGLGARENRIRQGEVSLHPMSKPPSFGAPGPSRCLPTPTPGTTQCDTDAPSSLRHHLHFKVTFIAGWLSACSSLGRKGENCRSTQVLTPQDYPDPKRQFKASTVLAKPIPLYQGLRTTPRELVRSLASYSHLQY